MSTENLQKFYRLLEKYPEFIPAITKIATRRFGSLNCLDYVNDFVCSMAEGCDHVDWTKSDKEQLKFLYIRFYNHMKSMNSLKFSLYASSSDRAFTKLNATVLSYDASATVDDTNGLEDVETEADAFLIDESTLHLFNVKELTLDLRTTIPTLQPSLQSTAQYFLDSVEKQVCSAGDAIKNISEALEIPISTAKFRYVRIIQAFREYLSTNYVRPCQINN